MLSSSQKQKTVFSIPMIENKIGTRKCYATLSAKAHKVENNRYMWQNHTKRRIEFIQRRVVVEGMHRNYQDSVQFKRISQQLSWNIYYQYCTMIIIIRIEIHNHNQMLALTTRLITTFSKWSKPKPKTLKIKENKKSFAIGDQKAAKLSKSEQEQENKIKALEQQKLEQQTIRKLKVMKSHTKSLEEYKSMKQLENIRIHQELYLKGRKVKPMKIRRPPQLNEENATYRIDELVTINPKNNQRAKRQLVVGNYTHFLNKKYQGQIEEFQGDPTLRRMGTLGIKLGMTTMWDSWGHVVPVTAIELDRVQVVQIKKPTDGNYLWQVQMGLSQKNFKRLTKPLLGHYVKARVPPKRKLAEFRVSEECLLPVGYMMSSRHYTPGMFVDVVGKTVGHGFQGTIKRHGFRRQPETHGNSLTTRVLGSTGGRQDPGRVFKNKKMYGRMGGKPTNQVGLQVFRIDVEKNIIYLKGSVPGKPGTIVKVTDTCAFHKREKNMDLVHFPTFVEKEGVQYARQFSMYCGERDPNQIQIHDNAFIIDDGEQESGGGVGQSKGQAADLDQ